LNGITIKNKLEVKPTHFVAIPGCEPVSSLSSLKLANAQLFYCKHSLITVKDLLRCIPGARLLRVMMPLGHLGSGWFIELPSGPPPDGCCLDPNSDWYSIMKTCAQDEPPKPNPECSGFNYNSCIQDIDPFKAPRNQNARPNSQPLDPMLWT
jgi:hypothetical protein